MTVANVGDWPSFEAVYESELDRIFAFLMVRTGSRQLAEDLTSETFLAAAQHWQSGKAADVSAAWLTTVAKRRLVDHWRSRDAQRRRLVRIVGQRTPRQNVADLLDPVTEGLSDEGVLRALSSLADRQRQALVLRYLDDLSVSEVADVLGSGYTATESLLARARRAFTSAYSETATPRNEGRFS